MTNNQSILEAGFGAVEITPDDLDFPLMGYGNRASTATEVHDSLWAKAMVLRQGAAAWALCSVDLCWVTAESVAAVRQQVADQTGLSGEAVVIIATHTHSGPSDRDAGNWKRPFVDLVTEAIVQAWHACQPATVGVGAGFLYGHSLNRRWFDRPVDPAVGVLRIDDRQGQLMGTLVNFACHPVVLGYDNYQVSADFVGYATQAVEAALSGPCIFTNGGCGDVNPLTETVRQQLAASNSFTTMARDARFYGDSDEAIAIGDRGGGTFAEAETIGLALAAEIERVAQGVETTTPTRPPWHIQAWVNHLDQGKSLIETQAFGVGDFAFVTQPGEVFAETGFVLKAQLRQRGFNYPWAVSYANDWQFYLTPENIFPEGGYEVQMAERQQHSPQLQSRLQTAIFTAVDQQFSKA